MMLGVAQFINEASNLESNNEIEAALRLYKAAFINILDINVQVIAEGVTVIPNVSPFEVRSVADYINHRTCQIEFNLNHPREAIAQFKKYIDTFKQHTKGPEYAFEHAAWLSQQYLMFADLFHQAVTKGVKASRAQHPGCYYFEAAIQMIERRQNITEFTNDCIRAKQMPVTNELLSMITTIHFAAFLRQCGWICVDPNDAPPVGLTKLPADQDVIEPINYSDIIIKALYKALEYFEEWNRPRMQNYINVLIADEYMLTKDLARAQTLYNRSLIMYDRENWSCLSDCIKHKLSLLVEREEQS